jgi:hypothetical protein
MEAKMAKADASVAPEGLAHDVEVDCTKVISVIDAALACGDVQDLPLVYAALEQSRTDLEKLRERAISERRPAVA